MILSGARFTVKINFGLCSIKVFINYKTKITITAEKINIIEIIRRYILFIKFYVYKIID